MYKDRYSHTIKLGIVDKILIILTFFCFIATVTFSLLSYYNSRENQIELVESSLVQYAEYSKTSIEEYFENKFQLLELLSTYPEVYTMDLQKQYDFFKSRENILNFEYFIIMDTKGSAYYVNTNDIKNQSQEQFFIDVMDNDRFLTDPFIEKSSKKSIITLSVSIYNNNEKVGSLCGVIDLDNINSLFANGSYSESGYGFLIDKDGYYVSHKNMDYVYNEKNVFKNSKNLNNINFFSTAIKNDKSIIDEVVLEGKSYYASFNPLDLKEWYVIFLIDKEYALNSLNSFMSFQILVIVFGILLLFLGVRILYRAMENHKLAYTDPLTNISNRAAFNRLFDKLDKSYKKEITIVCFDLNNFKYINDTYGHKFGDDLLCAFANILKDTLGSIGFTCRMGGDEFIAILVNENYEELIINVEKMVKSIKDYNNESKYKLEVSYGYSIREKEEKTPLINIHEDADKNMYIFKNTCKRK